MTDSPDVLVLPERATKQEVRDAKAIVIGHPTMSRKRLASHAQ